ncbi:hypothetical protein EDC01DRAFT_619037 [Geopyxis carbonaria]|nr:hypothetical protein EDC01DRAFT_619037 [Geopyxis carbonaria]
MAPTAAPINPMLDQLDFFAHPRPFKNPNYKAPIRRNKNLKQILSETTRSSGTSTPLPTDPNRLNNNVPLMQPTYQNIESAPSLRRGNKWCDITGLPAKYTDPKSKLRYADGEVYKVLRSLPAGGAEGYLEVRAANVILK